MTDKVEIKRESLDEWKEHYRLGATLFASLVMVLSMAISVAILFILNLTFQFTKITNNYLLLSLLVIVFISGIISYYKFYKTMKDNLKIRD